MSKIVTELKIEQKEHFERVGRRIKELRLKEGLSIKKLEELLNLPSGTTHHIEHGNGGSGINLLTIICHFASVGYSYKWLLDIDNENHFKSDEQHIYLEIDKSELIDLSEELEEFSRKYNKVVAKYK